MRWPYEQIGVTTARAFRNLLNRIIGDIGADMQEHKDRADNIQAQVDNLVADGDSSPEAAQARVGADGTNYTTLKQRLDTEHGDVTAQLADEAKKVEDAKTNHIENTTYEDLFERLDTEYKKWRDEFDSRSINLSKYDVVGDGSTDNTEKVSQAILDADNLNVPILVPSGTFLVNQAFDGRRFYGSGKLIYNDKEIRINRLPNNYSQATFQNGMAFNKNTYGTFNSATAFAVMANKDGEADVLGITPDNISQLATYGDRDSVSLYISNTSSGVRYDFSNVTYEEKAVNIPDLGDQDIQVGMIIDTLHSPKYSAFITKVDKDNKKLQVSGWFQQGNMADGQVPPNTAGIRVNPTTKIWGLNANTFLNANDPVTRSVIAEFGVHNAQDHQNADGIDMISFGPNKSGTAFIARPADDSSIFPFLTGFLSRKSGTGFNASTGTIGYHSEFNSLFGYRSYLDPSAFVHVTDNLANNLLVSMDVNGNSQFYVLDSGTLSLLKVARKVYSANATIDVTNCGIIMINGGTSYQFTTPGAKNSNEIVFVMNVTGTDITLNGSFSVGGYDFSSIVLHSGKSIQLISDASRWYKVDYQDSTTQTA